MTIVNDNLGILGSNCLNGALPQLPGIDEHIVLVDKREVLGRPDLRLGEGIPNQALHPVGRVDTDLGGDLVRRPLPHDSAVSAVQTLSPLPHHEKVDIAGIDQWCRYSRVVNRGAQIDVVVQSEAQTQ